MEAVEELVLDLPRAERSLNAFLARASALDQTCIDILHTGFALIEVHSIVLFELKLSFVESLFLNRKLLSIICMSCLYA